MAGNYYGFEERKPESQVNWFDIGKNISDTITSAISAREAKKQEFETGFKTALESLSDVPLGLDVEMQNKALQLANASSEALREQYNLVKNGKLSLNDFTKFKQNSLTGAKSYFDAIKNFNATAALKQQNLQSGKSQIAEGVVNEYLQKFANFKEYDFFVGPDGNTYMGKKEKKVDANGKEYEVITKNPNDIISTSAAKNLSLFTIDKFKTNEKADELAKGFGSFVKSQIDAARIGKQGVIKTIDDIRQSPAFDKMKKSTIAGVFSNKFNRLSVLTEDMSAVPGNDTYYPTFDKEEFKRDKSKILLVANSDGTITPEFHDEQIKKSDEFFGDLLESKLKREEKVSVTSELDRPAPRPIYKAEGPSEQDIKDQESARYYYGLIDDLFKGNNSRALPEYKKQAGAAWNTLATKIRGVQEDEFKGGKIDPNSGKIQFNIGGTNKTYQTNNSYDKVQIIRAVGEAAKLPERVINMMIDKNAYGN